MSEIASWCVRYLFRQVYILGVQAHGQARRKERPTSIIQGEYEELPMYWGIPCFIIALALSFWLRR